MVETAVLQKVLKEAMKAKKYTIGAKEAIASMKGSKAVVITRSLPQPVGAKLRAEADKHKVAVVETGLTSAELAKLMGRPHRVAALGLRSIGEGDLKQLTR
jgi:ribosomal protein L30E